MLYMSFSINTLKMAKDNSQNMQDLFWFLVYAFFLLLLVLQYFFFQKKYQRKIDDRRDALINVARV
jgi:preprotein translocase subunit SecG